MMSQQHANIVITLILKYAKLQVCWQLPRLQIPVTCYDVKKYWTRFSPNAMDEKQGEEAQTGALQ